MDKLLWDAMAASAITITMEDFFSTFLKKKTTKRNYVAMWLFYFIYHMTIMNMLNGYVGNFVGNVIALSIVCWFSYQSSFAINAMMTFVAISLSGIAEGLIAIAVIMITGSINGNIRLYALIAKIIFWMIIRVLAFLYKGKVEKSQRKIYGIILSEASKIFLRHQYFIRICNSQCCFSGCYYRINRNTSRFYDQGMGSCFCICTITF